MIKRMDTAKKSKDAAKSKKYPNLLQAMRLLEKAWEAVKPETIRNCFKHAGFWQNTVTPIGF
jgi:hypothetical protein